jgi:hypothetical protein
MKASTLHRTTQAVPRTAYHRVSMDATIVPQVANPSPTWSRRFDGYSKRSAFRASRIAVVSPGSISFASAIVAGATPRWLSGDPRVRAALQFQGVKHIPFAGGEPVITCRNCPLAAGKERVQVTNLAALTAIQGFRKVSYLLCESTTEHSANPARAGARMCKTSGTGPVDCGYHDCSLMHRGHG